MKTILKYMKPYNTYILLTLLLKFGASMMDLLIPSLLAKIIDDIVPLGEVRLIFWWGGVMILCAVISVTTNVRANRMAEISAGGMTRQLRHDLFEKITYLSAGQMNGFTVSSAVSRLTSDTYNVNRMMARMQRLGVRGPILLTGGILITVTMEPKLASVLIASLPFIIVIVWVVTKLSIPVYTGQQRVLDGLVRVLQENITGVRVIRALSRTDYERERYDGVNEELARIEQKAGRISSASGPATTLVLNLGLTAVIITGAYLVQKGETGPGAIIAFLSYFILILNAMLGITRIFVMCSKGMASLGRISEVLEAPEEMQVQIRSEESDKAIAGVTEESIPLVEFRDVSFSYNGKGDHLSHISFTLKKGESLGIIGATGSGKSTIVNLLLRFYDVDTGSIWIDGRRIDTIPYPELRAMFGVVFQNDYLMASSVEENIDFFRGLDSAQVREAAQCAQAEAFIREKEGEMDARIAVRGNNLSGGQKQRIMIARALAAKPQILILDDASSALDYKTDAKLRKELGVHFRNTTTINIAQRVSSIQGADHILVLEDGGCIGCGTHTELLEQCSEYRLIYELQMGQKEFGNDTTPAAAG
ncbi:MAG: ABC transporter ATP-binding protein/permease [Lachnospiraceae bacterium]|nr:ABC transporter ATP-binding protein/permease [Lachnospiraceae bacterium]